MTGAGLKYVNRKDDRVRYYFRRRGMNFPLPGLPGSDEFMAAYGAALVETAHCIIPSTLPGGIVRPRGRKNPNAVQPLIGVYLLMLKGKIVYVGESLNMPKRVAEHRSNGRPFDQAYYIAPVANQRANLERILIRAINPPGNRAHRANGEHPSVKPAGRRSSCRHETAAPGEPAASTAGSRSYNIVAEVEALARGEKLHGAVGRDD